MQKIKEETNNQLIQWAFLMQLALVFSHFIINHMYSFYLQYEKKRILLLCPYIHVIDYPKCAVKDTVWPKKHWYD